MSTRPAVFLDRDGVINEALMIDGRPCSPTCLDEFRLIEGVLETCQALAERRIPLIVVTNQPEVARGSLALDVVEAMHERLRSLLPVDQVICCPHDDADGCRCRKPQPGMLLNAARRHRIDLGRSVMIGDRWRDVETARAAGCYSVLLGDGYGEPHRGVSPDVQVASLPDALGPTLQLLAQGAP